jgi:hypothetical protein
MKKLIDFALVTNSGTAIIEACANGGGIAVLPSYIHALDPRLVTLDLAELAPIQFWMTYTERVRRLPRGQAVIDWLRTIFDKKKHVWFRSAFIHPNRLNDDELLIAELSKEREPSSTHSL